MKKIKSFAKINLFLKVTGKQNKYHSLYSLVTQINLYDEVLVKENKDNKSRVFFSGPFKIYEKNKSAEIMWLNPNSHKNKFDRCSMSLLELINESR